MELFNCNKTLISIVQKEQISSHYDEKNHLNDYIYICIHSNKSK